MTHIEQAYLPGTIRERLQDLLKGHKITQSDLAIRIGSTESTISRFISGKTDKLSDENIIRIAKLFDVSTDFLLGVVDIPDRKNFHIAELGLSAQATRNLYTGKVNPQVVNLLLESPRFATLTYMISNYFDDTLASGYAAQNQMFTSVQNFVRPVQPEAARDIGMLKTPVYQADLTSIEHTFLTTVKEIKKDVGSALNDSRALTKATTEKLLDDLTKGQDIQKLSITPEQVAAAITSTIPADMIADAGVMDELNQALVHLMQAMQKPSKPSKKRRGG